MMFPHSYRWALGPSPITDFFLECVKSDPDFLNAYNLRGNSSYFKGSTYCSECKQNVSSRSHSDLINCHLTGFFFYRQKEDILLQQASPSNPASHGKECKNNLSVHLVKQISQNLLIQPRQVMTKLKPYITNCKHS